jgi:hypothetical protein
VGVLKHVCDVCGQEIDEDDDASTSLGLVA